MTTHAYSYREGSHGLARPPIPINSTSRTDFTDSDSDVGARVPLTSWLTSGTSSLVGVNGTATFINGAHMQRARRTCTVSRFAINIPDKTSVTEITPVAFRYNVESSPMTFKCVAVGDAIAAGSITPGWKVYTLSTALSVQDGDFPGVILTTAADVTPIQGYTTTSNARDYQLWSIASSVELDTSYEVTTTNQKGIQMGWYAGAPGWCGAGDSFMSGYAKIQSYAWPSDGGQNWYDMTPGADILGQCYASAGDRFMRSNHGKGSSTCQQWTANDWWTDYVVNYYPRACLVSFGTNDIAIGRTLTQFAADMRVGVKTLQAAGVIPVVIDIPPISTGAQSGFPDIAQKWNHAIRSMCFELGVPHVDFWSNLVGAGLYTYDTDLYYADHPTAAGYAVIAANLMARVVAA